MPAVQDRCPLCKEPTLAKHCGGKEPSPTCDMLTCFNRVCGITVNPRLGIAYLASRNQGPTRYWDRKDDGVWERRLAS